MFRSRSGKELVKEVSKNKAAAASNTFTPGAGLPQQRGKAQGEDNKVSLTTATSFIEVGRVIEASSLLMIQLRKYQESKELYHQ